MTNLSKLLFVLALCLTLTDCANSAIYPMTVTATGGGVTHSIVIEVQIVK